MTVKILTYENFQKTEKFRLPENKILLFGLYGFVFMATVGIIGDWSALWFARDLKTTALVASLAVTAWGAGETIGRLSGGKLIEYTNQKFVGAYLGIIGCTIFFLCVLTFNEYLILFGNVDPHLLLILNPLGDVPISWTIAPNDLNS